MSNVRVIISGGGTGGHIFPAISIANALKVMSPGVSILFVGAEGRMEMQRVPDAGYSIIGLPIAGFDRKHLWKNIGVLIKLFRSQRRARRIIKEFRPQVAVGVGGYASGPTLKVAANMGIPTLIQEQNSYAGVTNKLLAKRAVKICVAYDGMEKFFPAAKLILTGNPVRKNLLPTVGKEEAAKQFSLISSKKIVLILGGSLGARSINEAVKGSIELIKNNPETGFIWQTGKVYYPAIQEAMKTPPANLFITDFIGDMSAAYAAADLVVSRAGAGSISEFCMLGKPVILVPSPNVAEDHQTKNAQALTARDAALLITDEKAGQELIYTALETVGNEARLAQLAANIGKMALPYAAEVIAREVLSIVQTNPKE
jgi:UDP-N-acetylglucosamine--N-acetylmuramyl-(pentapeptide) pyrophosphoryl-undecaprenol N-acetylglucosamine transferase